MVFLSQAFIRINIWMESGRFVEDSNQGSPIPDVEVMIGHDPLLIDVLALETGVCTHPTRSLKFVLESYSRMKGHRSTNLCKEVLRQGGRSI